MSEREQDQTGTITRTRAARKVQKPPMFKVLLHNDNFTTREFVVEILRTVFHHSEGEATRIMLHVHQRGVGLAGIYTFEVAEIKVGTVEALAQQHQFPLMLTIEPEE